MEGLYSSRGIVKELQIKASVICLGLLPNSYSEPPTLEFGCTTDNSHNLSILSFLDGPPAESYFALPITEQSKIWEVSRPFNRSTEGSGDKFQTAFFLETGFRPAL
jgi:hypothetical protein